MSPKTSRNIDFVCRWGAVSMAQGCDLETRLRTLLLPGERREPPRRIAATLTLAAAIAATVALNVFHLQAASATSRTAFAAGGVSAQQAEDRYTVAARDGVTLRAVAVSERMGIDGTAQSDPQQKWWRPDGTLYAGRPDVGKLDKTPVQLILPAPKQIATRRRLWFVLELDGALQEDDLFTFAENRGMTAGDFSTSENMGNGRLLLDYCSLEPADRAVESFRVGITTGPWTNRLRLPVSSESEPASQLRKELDRLERGAKLPDTGQLYAPESGSSEFRLILPQSDTGLASGDAERFELLDSDGHRLAKGRNQLEKDVPRNYIIERFKLDKATAQRTAYMAIKSSPFKYVTIKDVATGPRRTPSL